ncbi:malonic semialdehyde reductase [Nesterenkonia sp. AN1]|uniref:malonic semialdehyde reductase n=1 Tax=Nesterenkonia sp. AN1 TaxID=652017 RepID=UPI0004BA6140|nr:malonic semialdehyde reductase [Nesterenkonia sp. AN1]
MPTATAAVDRETMHQLFEGRHTTNLFSEGAVDLALIQQAYQDARWAPTSMNCQPMRLTVLNPGERRDAVVEHFKGDNGKKTYAAPLTVVLAYDPNWHEHMPTLYPQAEGLREKFAGRLEFREKMGRDNAFLQAGYFIVALRALGLDVGPMAGLDAPGVDAEVHADTGWKTLMVLNVGHGPSTDEDAQYPRGERFDFAQISQVL